MLTEIESPPAAAAPPTPAAPAPEDKRRYVHRLFTQIAPRYDWFNRLGSFGLDRRWRRAAVAQAGLGAGHRVLDVCAGTGDVSLLAARRHPEVGMIVGLDFTAAMLSLAQVKQRRAGAAVSWVQGDAQALPFKGATFDRVLIGFSTRNLSDLDGGLRELVRVLRPGGRLVILETGYPRHPLVRAGYQAFLFTVARTIGLLLTGRCWPFSYLARSVRQFLTPTQMLERLAACATQARYQPLSFGLASLYIATKRTGDARHA